MTTSTTTTTDSTTSHFQSIASLFCGCASAVQPWETYTAMYEENDEHHPYYYNFETGSNNKKEVVIVWEKQQQPQQQQHEPGKSHYFSKQNINRTTPATQSCTIQSDACEAIVASSGERMLRSSPSTSEDTCTTVSMNSVSFDAWEDDEDDDDDDEVIVLNKIPDLTLSARVFSNDTGCSFSFYASPALAHDEGEDDVNSLTSDEEEVEDVALRI